MHECPLSREERTSLFIGITSAAGPKRQPCCSARSINPETKAAGNMV